MLAEMEKNGGSPLKMAARSGSKDVLERVLGVIRREFPENEVRYHSVWHTGHTTPQTTTTGAYTQDMTPVN